LTGREAVTFDVGTYVPPLVSLKRPITGCWNQNFSQWEHSDFVKNWKL